MCFTFISDKLEKSPKHFLMVLLPRLIIHDSLHLLLKTVSMRIKGSRHTNSGVSYLAVFPG